MAASFTKAPRPLPQELPGAGPPSPTASSELKDIAIKALSSSAIHPQQLPKTRRGAPAVGKTDDTAHVGTTCTGIPVVETAPNQRRAPSHATLITSFARRSVSSVDTAASAMQTADADSDYTANMLRRKHAAAAAAAVAAVAAAAAAVSVGVCSNSYRPAKGAAAHREYGTTSAAALSGRSSATSLSTNNHRTPTDDRGGTRAAFCLIPQPYHDSADCRGLGRDAAGDGLSARSCQRNSDSRDCRPSGDCSYDWGYGLGGGGVSAVDPPDVLPVLDKRKAAVGDHHADSDSDGECSGDQSMSAEYRLKRSREQNRQSSRKARIRRKSEEVSLKQRIENIQVRRELELRMHALFEESWLSTRSILNDGFE